MKRDFDVHRDVLGPQVTFMLHVLADALQSEKVSLPGLQIDVLLPDNILVTAEANKNRPSLLSGGGLIFRDWATEPIQTLKYFDFSAEEYDLASMPFKQKFWPAVKRHIEGMIGETFRILDPSCGTGFECLELSRMVPKGEVVAVDLSTKMIQRAYRNARLAGRKNIAFFHADNHELPPAWDGAFDIVFCFLSFHYYENAQRAADVFVRVLHQKGLLIIVEPFHHSTSYGIEAALKSANPHFQQYYSSEELYGFFKSHGFKIAYFTEIFRGIGFTVLSRS